MKAKLVPLSSTDNQQRFYRAVLEFLNEGGFHYLVGGGHALKQYAGTLRVSKDLDLFVRRADLSSLLEWLSDKGFLTELSFPHWLAKAKFGRDYVDLIFRAGNGLCEVDDSWFERARDDKLLGLDVKLCAPEETIWMKAFIMERERFDGADIAHILVTCAEKLDWQHLVRRFGPDWRVLLSHLVLFGYIYPSEQARIPTAIIGDLIGQLQRDAAPSGGDKRLCRGTLLSRKQYLVDVQKWGFHDARLDQRVHMNSKDIVQWTKAIPKEEKVPGKPT